MRSGPSARRSVGAHSPGRTTDVVFITGATSGIGTACARRFAAAGHPLVLVGRRTDRLARLRRQLGVPVHALGLDLTDRRAIAEAIAALPKEFARVGILINNAGTSIGIAPVFEADLDDWEAMIDTNIKGLAYCTRLLVDGMVARDRGHIVNIGSPAAHFPYPGGNVYGATKAFVRQFSLNLRSDLLGRNIRVTCIEPGLVRTELFARRFKGDKRKVARLFRGVEPLRPDDLAEVVHWCTSLPRRVNVNAVELMPLGQAFAPLAVHRRRLRRSD